MESLTELNLIPSTTLSLLFPAGSSASLSSVNLDQTQKSTVKSSAPTKNTFLTPALTPQQVKFAEEPIHLLMGKSVKDMSLEELTAHCEYLRSLRKSPQTLNAKLAKDEAMLDGEYGEPEVKKLRAAASKTLTEKTKKKSVNSEAQGAKLAGKYLNFGPTPTP